jgi:hypothetical protein
VKVYADTGWICSLYTPDANSASAISRMRRVVLPLPFTWLHQLEFRNALRLRVFRKELTIPQRDASLNAMLGDLAGGIFVQTPVALPDVMTEGERLSAIYSESLGTRTLDILHVASAVVLGIKQFLIFDHRQAALAKAAGLKVP